MKILVDRHLVCQAFADARSSNRKVVEDNSAAWRMFQTRNVIEVCLTERSLNWIYRTCESKLSISLAREMRHQVQATFEILPISYKVIYRADKSSIEDLECAVDIICAKANSFHAILTGTPQTYANSGLLEVSLKTLSAHALRDYLSRGTDLPLLLVGSLSDLLFVEGMLVEQEQAEPLKQVVPLQRWLASFFGQDWLPEEELDLPRLAAREVRANQSRPSQSRFPVRGKLLNFEGLDTQLALLLRVHPHSETELEAQLTLRTTEGDATLPAELELRLFDEQGRLNSTYYPRPADTQLEMPIIGEVGERFSLEFRLRNACLTEEFVF